MRFLLILVNALLLGILAFGAVRLIRTAQTGAAEEFSVKKSDPSGGSATAAARAQTAARERKTSEVSSEAALDWTALAQTAGEHNIFDVSRCPSAKVPGSSGSTAVQLDMTLAGTFTAGQLSGAIILQKSKNLSALQNQQNQWTRRNQPQTPVTPRPGSGSTRFGVGETDDTAALSFKQYVRCGETLSNGYRLDSVTRTTALLTRGSEKLELTLTEASKIQSTAAAAATTAKTGQEAAQEQFRAMMEARARMREMGPPPGGMMPPGEGGGEPGQDDRRGSMTGDGSRDNNSNSSSRRSRDYSGGGQISGGRSGRTR